MNNTSSPLQNFEDNWETTLGGAVAGERVVVRGKNLFNDINEFSWLKLLMFMITGREFSDEKLELLDKIWALTISYPDPRIWNNRVGAFAGTTRSTASLGVGAAMAVTEAKIYGGQAILSAMDFIVHCKQELDKQISLEDIIKAELKSNRAICGYGRPVTSNDERIAPIEQLIRKHGLENSEHVRLAYKIEHFLMNGRWRMQMNIAGLAAAIGADMGLSVREYYLWLVNGFNAGITACYIDANDKVEGGLFPLTCNRIKYEGISKRNWN